MNNRVEKVEEFYSHLNRLVTKWPLSRISLLKDLEVPERGVYFIFEPQEFRDNQVDLRVTRIGINLDGEQTLIKRLRLHHSGVLTSSAFRRHVASCKTIGFDGSTSAIDDFMQQTLVTFVEVPSIQDRCTIEKTAIALLSNFKADVPVDPPSDSWLGLTAKSKRVSNSGLWNSHYVADKLECENLFRLLKRYI